MGKAEFFRDGPENKLIWFCGTRGHGKINNNTISDYISAYYDHITNNDQFHNFFSPSLKNPSKYYISIVE